MRQSFLSALILLLAATAACALTIDDIPFAVDPNQIQGTLLPPISGDPNTWELPVGMYTRTGAAYHVAYIEIDYEACMPRVSNSIFLFADSWQFDMWVVPGVNYKVVKAFADPRYANQVVKSYTIVVRGILPPGDEPELE